MILRRGLRLDTLIEGGNGVRSLDTSMGDSSPERYEGGTLCLPAIVGLTRGIEFIRQIGLDTISAHEKKLWQMTLERLEGMRRIKICDTENSGSVMLFNIDGYTPEQVGDILSEKGFCTRTGYHCAALAHKALATDRIGGVRISFGLFNTPNDVEALTAAISDIART